MWFKLFLSFTLLFNCYIFSQTKLWKIELDFAPYILKLDYSGSIIVAGENVLKKFSSSGEEIWQVNFGIGEFNIWDYFYKDLVDRFIAIDGENNIYINDGLELRKFNSSGNLLWNINISRGAIKIDNSGNIYFDRKDSGVLTKISKDGNLLWELSFNVPPGPYYAFDKNNNCYLTIGAGDNFKVMKILSNGSIAWEKEFLAYKEKEIISRNRYEWGYYESYVHNLVVDTNGNAYLGCNESKYNEVVIEPPGKKSYVRESTIDKGIVTFFNKDGSYKNIFSIKGKHVETKTYEDSYVKRVAKWSGGYVRNLFITKENRIYVIGNVSDKDDWLFRFDNRKQKILWKKKFPQNVNYYPIRPLIDNNDNIYIFQTSKDSIFMYLFNINGGIIQTNPILSLKEWYNSYLGNYKFDAEGNLYGVQVLDSIGYLVKFSPVRSPQNYIESEFDYVEDVKDYSFALFNNFPNPFNPTTTIQYALPEDAKVSLKIYNTLGQVVRILIDEIQEQGYKTVEFDASDLPSGVYFYKITANSLSNNYTSVKKMMLVK